MWYIFWYYRSQQDKVHPTFIILSKAVDPHGRSAISYSLLRILGWHHGLVVLIAIDRVYCNASWIFLFRMASWASEKFGPCNLCICHYAFQHLIFFYISISNFRYVLHILILQLPTRQSPSHIRNTIESWRIAWSQFHLIFLLADYGMASRLSCPDVYW